MQKRTNTFLFFRYSTNTKTRTTHFTGSCPLHQVIIMLKNSLLLWAGSLWTCQPTLILRHALRELCLHRTTKLGGWKPGSLAYTSSHHWLIILHKRALLIISVSTMGLYIVITGIMHSSTWLYYYALCQLSFTLLDPCRLPYDVKCFDRIKAP